jgi:RNA polymerase sigma factor (sigma-70 family)
MIAVAEPRKTVAEEAILLERFQLGDSEAGWELVLSKRRLIARLCARISREDTDDLIQEFMLQLFGWLKKFDPAKSSLNTFIYMTAGRRLHRIARAVRGKETTVPDDDDSIGLVLDESSSEVEELLREVSDVCHDVPQIGLAALRYIYLDGLSRAACVKRLRGEFPEAFEYVRLGALDSYVDKLVQDSLDQLQESVGIRIADSEGRARRWTPAQHMLLKREQDEQRNIREAILSFAEANPSVSARAIHKRLGGEGISADSVRRLLAANGIARTGQRRDINVA